MIEKKEIILEGITFDIYKNNSLQPKHLLFFFHGFTANRFDGNNHIKALVDTSAIVIAGDAYFHGERERASFKSLTPANKQREIINIVIKTAQEIKYFYNKYCSLYPGGNSLPLTAYGVSMGAAIALYLGTIMSELKTIVSIVGSPSFCDFYKYKQQRYSFLKDDYFNINLNSYKKEDPLEKYQLLQGKNIFLSGGVDDEIVPMIYAKELARKLKSSNVIFKKYNIGHASTKEMLNDSYEFIKKYN